MNTFDEMIVVIEAAKARKPIQIKAPGDTDWRDCGLAFENFAPDFTSCEYRVKPMPQVVWLKRKPEPFCRTECGGMRTFYLWEQGGQNEIGFDKFIQVIE